jgi:hypothetical protein
LLKASLEFDDDEEDRLIAALVLPGSKKSEVERADRYALPEPGAHSEWSCAAVLRTDWPHSKPHLSVLYPEKKVLMELSTRREVLWSGEWTWEILLDGQPVLPASDWEESCWVSDDDADFLELEIELTGGLRMQRQLVLAREDRFLLAADVILGDRPCELEYRACLPLAEEITWEASEDSYEGFLAGRRRGALVLPLALPEWRDDTRSVGMLRRTDNGLELTQKAKGCSMYCPLWFDLDSRRMGRSLTWRNLTVAESLEVQPADVAAGYRVQVGDEQWLVYRSLAERANRTLLGHNLSSEMLVGRFDEAGEVEPLVEVE